MKHDQNNLNADDSIHPFETDDLSWLAFCYIADELNETQRAAFELRLEHDELAQNSLVDAMLESNLVFATLESTSSNFLQNQDMIAIAPQAPFTHRTDEVRGDSGRTKFGTRLGLFLALPVAILIMVGSWSLLSNHSNDDSAVAESTIEDSANDESDRLASAWVDTMELMNEAELDELIDEESQGDLTDESSDWMFVALTDLESSTDDNEGESY